LESRRYEIYFDGANIKTSVSGVRKIQHEFTLPIHGVNKKASKTALSGTQYHFIFPYWMKGQEVGKLSSIFGTTFDTIGVEFKIHDIIETEGFPG
jgi:hypothetical protein